MLWTLLLFVVFILIFYHYINYLFKDEKFDKIPGPKGTFLIENGLDFLMESAPLFTYFRNLANKYKDLYKLKIFNKKVVLIYNPEDIETVLTNTKYNDKGFMYYFLRPWLNDGLLVSDGAKWHQRRKILTPAFHFNILRHFSTILVENSERLVESLRSETDKSGTEIYSFIAGMTLNSICETAMGTALDDNSKDIGKKYKDAIHILGKYLFYRGERFWLYPMPLFNLSSVGRNQKKLLSEIGSFRDHVIKQRREDGTYKNLYTEVLNEKEDDVIIGEKKRLAMLDLLLETEEKGKIDIEGINEEVDTFMFEGHDTTATALQYAFMLIANHPEVQDKILEECRQIFGTSDRKPTMSDLADMKYLECCIKETLRLYPSVYFIIRYCKHELKLKNYEVPAGSDCSILIFDLHRRSDQFVEPLKFRPERFQEEPTWHPFAYIPFSAGPRNCIGQKFAMMEMKLAISAVLQQYRLLPVTKPEDIVFIADIILRTRDPVYVKFEKR
ncbi:cytochrome P450 4C1-like isoform X1 [Vanessa cardui]|uniref:cytochrome P450 4C1-like isoform X1 n=1 Tax=Vanessa cardui TaxID=171605 RepID=UPI001F12A9ED|nr:cytochrome P450 4C1-like isoform X1 [Vanessa cardui]